MGPRIREDMRGDGRDWMFRLQLRADSLKFLWPPLGTKGSKDELDGGWKKMFQEIEAG